MAALETIKFNLPLRDVRVVDERERERRAAAQLRDAYDRGMRDGERKLSEQLVKQRSEILELKNGVLNTLLQTLPGVVNECQDALVALALQVAEKLVAGLPVSVEMVEASVREALTQMEEAATYTVELNPSDLQLLEQYDSPLRKTAHDDGVELVAVPEISRGGCIVRSRFGVVDTQRETKMALLRKNTE
jgi:flagellar assembly protein FliH